MLAGSVSAVDHILNPGDSIQQNITDAASGDTLILNPGWYNESGITVTKDIIIRGTPKGADPSPTVIDARNTGRIFTVNTGVTFVIDNLTLRNGYTADTGGGAIQTLSSTTLHINSSVISDCSSPGIIGGGALLSSSNTIILSSSRIQNCSAISGGAIRHSSAGTILISDSSFVNCSSTTTAGGALAIGSSVLTITTSEFRNCSSPSSGGGAIYSTSNTLNVLSSTFYGCTCHAASPGSVIRSDGGTTVFHFSRIYQNSGIPLYLNSGSFDASMNWWGTNADPSGFTSGGVTTSPWLVLGATATPQAIPLAGTSVVRANLTFNNTGTDASPIGLVPDGIPVAFAIIDGTGSTDPLSGNITAGSNSTVFTPAGYGITNISSTVDDQTVFTTVAATPPVHTLNPGDSIQQNITDANSGDTLILNPGTYYQHGITISKNISILANTSAGGSAANTIIDGSELGAILDNGAGYTLVIDNLTLRNGATAGNGGAINCNFGNLTITSSVFSWCSANAGGAINAGWSTVTITSSSFFNCSSDMGGSAFFGLNPVSTTIRYSRFVNNTATVVASNAGSIDAANNWWSSNADPTSLVTESTVTVSPWLMLGIAASPASIMSGQSSLVRANLTWNSDDNDTSDDGFFVPDGIPVAYTVSLGSGSLQPGAGSISSGFNATTFTPDTGLSSTVFATVDGQGVSADIMISPYHTLNPGDSIQQNITDAGDGDTLILNPGTYTEQNITVSRSITIQANTSAGGTAANTVIAGGGTARIFSVGSGIALILENVTVQNGRASDGAGILSSGGSLRITSSAITNCSATVRGGGINAGSSYVTVISSTISGCSANSGAAVFLGSGNTATINFSRLAGNTGTDGSIVYNGGAAIDASNNWWGSNGDPADLTYGSVNVDPWLMLGASAHPATVAGSAKSMVRANLTYNSVNYDTSDDGFFVTDGIPVAFAVTGGSGTLAPSAGTINSGVNTTAFTPTATGMSTVSVTVDGETVTADVTSSPIHTLNPGDSIQQNITDANPGDTIILNPGIYFQNSITISKAITIRANSSAGGNAANTVIDGSGTNQIFLDDEGHSLTLDNLTLQHAFWDMGGAVRAERTIVYDGTLTITSCIFSNNVADTNGGAIYAGGMPVQIVSSTFSNCMAFDGGAVAATGGSTMTINRSVFTNNYASRNGGAIYTLTAGTTVSVVSSAFSGNTALSTGSAFRVSNGVVDIHFCRFSGNSGTTIYRSTGTVNAENNWWGTNSDPSGSVSGATVIPWLVLNITALPGSIGPQDTSTVTVNLTRNSSGYDTTGMGLSVPEGIPVAFAKTRGSLDPLAGNITSGANTTTFTPGRAGNSTISATVDGEIATTVVFAGPIPVSKIGVHDGAVFALDNDGSFSWNAGDLAYTFGSSGDTPVVGDWDHDFLTEIGVFNNGTWYLDFNGNGVYDGPVTDRAYTFGSPGFRPVIGDWNGDGSDEVGVELNGIWAVDYNGNGAWDGASTDRFAAFGQTGDIPVVGDWDGNGADEIGSHLDGFWAIDYNGDYAWSGTTDDRFAGLGQAADIPVIGDWNGDGKEEIGMETMGFWAVDYNGNYVWDGIGPDRFAGLGQAGDTPVVGDWDGNGFSEICSFVSGFWAVDYNGNYAWDGVTEDRFAGFGSASAVPVAGAWS